MRERRTRLESAPVGTFALAVVLCAAQAACTREPEGGSEAALVGSAESRVPAVLRPFYAAELELEGTWLADWVPKSDSTKLVITRFDEHSYWVRVSREPDYGTSFFYEVTAEWREGGLWLRGAEVNTHGAVLYPAFVAGGECLIPRDSLDALAEGCELWSQEQELAFRRVGPRPSKCPEIFRALPAIAGEQDAMELEMLRYYLPGPKDEYVPKQLGDDE